MIYNMTPIDHMSVVSSYCSLLSISGDVNRKLVDGLVTIKSIDVHDPKSNNYSLYNFTFNRKQSGLKLRCMTPFECKYLVIDNI